MLSLSNCSASNCPPPNPEHTRHGGVWFAIVLAILFGVLRFFQPTHELSLSGSYQAFAHLYVGGLIGAWLVSKKPFWFIMTIVMIAVELTAFFSIK